MSDAEHYLQNMRHLHSDVTNQTLDVVAKLRDVSQVVVDAAKKVEQNKTVIHRQNEALLMERVEEITKAINELKAVETSMQIAASKQATAALAPLMEEMSSHVGRLAAKDLVITELTNSALITHAKIANNMWIAALFGIFLFLAGFISAWAMFKH